MLQVAWSPVYNHPLPENHRFPMVKYDLIKEQLQYEGTLSESNFFTPKSLDHQWILTTHSTAYLNKLLNLQLNKAEIRRTGFPLTKSLVDREIVIMGGTLECCQYALETGVSLNIAGGTHHAYSDHGEGFCLLNDLAIAANYLIAADLAKRVLIVDLDVHQGNGTASLFAQRDDVYTLSIHGQNNYPYKKEWSDCDVALPDGTDDERYLAILDEVIDETIRLHSPDFVLYQCGVDVLANDKLGRIGMTVHGIKERDRLLFNVASSKGIPVVASMGGGYSEKLADIIECHANTFRLAQEIYF